MEQKILRISFPPTPGNERNTNLLKLKQFHDSCILHISESFDSFQLESSESARYLPEEERNMMKKQKMMTVKAYWQNSKSSNVIITEWSERRE